MAVAWRHRPAVGAGPFWVGKPRLLGPSVLSASLAEAALRGLDFLLGASLAGALGLSEDTLGRVLQQAGEAAGHCGKQQSQVSKPQVKVLRLLPAPGHPASAPVPAPLQTQ